MNLNSFLSTVLMDGGASYNIITGDTVPNTGYMVGIDGYETRYDQSSITNSDVRNYVITYIEILSDGETFLGGWLDKQANEICLDVSIHIADREEAVEFARNNNQIAIYDCKYKRDIIV
jgi:hypothetical protein